MKKRSEFLPYAKPCYTTTETEYVAKAIQSGWWSTGGYTRELEQEVIRRTGATYGVAVNSCTAALQLAWMALGIEKGQEVITTPMTFCSTLHSILHAGGTPVLCDIDPETGLMDAEEIEKHITPATAGILPVHYGGQCCDMDVIMALAEQYKLHVVEDAAHAFGTTYQEKEVGNLCHATAFSFYATKNLATGEGGMLTTNSKEIYEKAMRLSLHGMEKNAYLRYANPTGWGYDVKEIGCKCNMSDIAAALGLAQLSHFDAMQEKRSLLANEYDQRLSSISGLKCLSKKAYGTHNHHLYVVRVTEEFPVKRDSLIQKLYEEYHIGCSVHFIPVYQFTCYQPYFPKGNSTYPKTQRFFEEIISLPLYPDMKIEDVEYVTDALREIARQHEK